MCHTRLRFAMTNKLTPKMKTIRLGCVLRARETVFSHTGRVRRPWPRDYTETHAPAEEQIQTPVTAKTILNIWQPETISLRESERQTCKTKASHTQGRARNTQTSSQWRETNESHTHDTPAEQLPHTHMGWRPFWLFLIMIGCRRTCDVKRLKPSLKVFPP